MDELLAFRARHKKEHEHQVNDNHPHTDSAKQPYINRYGDLVIPFGSDPKYHYWRGGQSIADTLKLLGVTAANEQYRN